MTVLKEILLVDDNAGDNFWNKRIIKRSGLDVSVTVAFDGKEALDYLTTPDEQGNYPMPGLIFLDINMPRMNGWEFLEAYDQFKEAPKRSVTVMMLTTSSNPDDVVRAKKHHLLDHFMNKPLDDERFKELISEFFPESLD